MQAKPLLIAAGVGVALLLLSRRSNAGTLVGQTRPVISPGAINRTPGYANPQIVADNLARSVVAQVFGIFSKPVSSIGTGIGSADARDAIRKAEGGDYYGWTGPVISDVADTAQAAIYSGDPYWGGEMVDSIPAGPAYDVTTDFSLNPWLAAAP